MNCKLIRTYICTYVIAVFSLKMLLSHENMRCDVLISGVTWVDVNHSAANSRRHPLQTSPWTSYESSCIIPYELVYSNVCNLKSYKVIHKI
jgi:hypothetical protein